MTTKIPVELSSTPGIVDNSNATAITIDSSENVTLTGQITIGSGNNIINAGNLTIDAGGDITLDAGGTDIILSDDGTIFGTITRNSGMQIRVRENDQDMYLKGVDGGTEFTALTLDMSDAGTATFNNSVTLSNELLINGTGTAQLKINGATGSDSVLRFYDGGSESWMLRQTNSDNVLSFRRNSNNYLSLSASGVVSTVGDVTVGGNLTVQGTTTTLNTATLDVEDKNITLNVGSGDTSGSANGAGITIQDAVDASNNATILWDASNDEFDFSHGITLPDGQKLQLGASNDLQIYHSGSHSHIHDAGSGNLYLDTNGTMIELTYNGNTENMAQFAANGAVTLYHDNAKKIETTSGGATVTGTLIADGLVLGDNETAYFGTDLDLRILYTGSAGQINNTVGDLTLDVAGELKLDADGGNITLQDGGTAIGQFQLNDTNHLKLVAKVSDADIFLQGNDGGSTITALRLDMSEAGTATFNNAINVNGDLKFNSGYGSSVIGYGVRAWVNFNGTGTVAIRDHGNVSSITDNGTGDYTVNFATALPDTNYCVVGSGISAGNHPAISLSISNASGAQATGSIRVHVGANGGNGSTGFASDVNTISVAVIR